MAEGFSNEEINHEIETEENNTSDGNNKKTLKIQGLGKGQIEFFKHLLKKQGLHLGWFYDEARQELEVYISIPDIYGDENEFTNLLDIITITPQSLSIELPTEEVKRKVEECQENFPTVFIIVTQETGNSTHLEIFGEDTEVITKAKKSFQPRQASQTVRHLAPESSPPPEEHVGCYTDVQVFFYPYPFGIPQVNVINGNILEKDGNKHCCIVNPCVRRKSGKLDSHGDFFYHIKTLGGQQYVQELEKAIVDENTKIIVTKGGNLGGMVFHPISKVSNTRDGAEEVYNIMFTCLEAAQTYKIEVIKLPFIYSGSAGIPIKICAHRYAMAITEFTRQHPRPKYPDYIHFIDQNDDSFKEVVQCFKHCIPQTHNHLMRVEPTGDGCNFAHSSRFFKVGKHTVHVEQGDIRDSKCQAIVCPEYPSVPNSQTNQNGDLPIGWQGGVLAFGLKTRFRKAFDSHKLDKVHTKGNIARTVCKNIHSPVEYLLHARCDPSDVGKCIQDTLTKLKRFSKLGIKSIAIPLLGIEEVSDISSVQTACQVFVRALRDHLEPCPLSPLDVHLVNHCPVISAWLQHSLDNP